VLGPLAQHVEAVVEAGDVLLFLGELAELGLTSCRLTIIVVNGTLRAILLVVTTNDDISMPVEALSPSPIDTPARIGSRLGFAPLTIVGELPMFGVRKVS
jgi:hypothetical protein